MLKTEPSLLEKMAALGLASGDVIDDLRSECSGSSSGGDAFSPVYQREAVVRILASVPDTFDYDYRKIPARVGGLSKRQRLLLGDVCGMPPGLGLSGIREIIRRAHYVIKYKLYNHDARVDNFTQIFT